MFRNLVANAVFSPSVVSGIGFYVKRLRQEEFTRRLGLIFMSLAVALQSLAIISPPEPTIAAGPNNIIYSGVTSVGDLLSKYDANDAGNGNRDVQAIFDHYGISRDDLANAQISTIRSTDRNKKLRSIGRKAYGKTGETAVKISGSSTTVYERYLWSWDSGAYSTYKVIQGTTGDGRWFAVLMNCGNLVVDEPPPAPQNPVGQVSATCDAITGWAYDPNNKKQAIEVQIYVRVLHEPDSLYKQKVKANLSQPSSPADGNHGFRLEIPSIAKSNSNTTVYTVVALDSVGGGNNTTLAKTQRISGFCKTDDKPRHTVKVCEFKTGNVISIDQSQFDDTKHGDASECEKIQVCMNDKLVSIPVYEHDDEPLTCPTIEVCRDGIVISITSDERQSGDLEPSQCEQIEVCREGQLVTIIRDDRQPKDTDPDPTLLCDEPLPILAFAKAASNQTQDIESANGTTASPGDIIVYTLRVENIGTVSGDVEFEEDISDVLEYAELIDADGGQLDDDSGVITWQTLTIKPNEEASKKITVRIKEDIPPAPSPISNLESNNLELRNVWHDNTVTIKVPRPITKTPEVLAANLPKTGPGANAALSFVLIIFSAYFYARSRQLARELKLVQLEYANGVSR